jgi:hypothetical protein
MMISVKDAVKQGFTFDKVANFELSKDTSDWNEQILNRFFQEVDYLSRDYSVEVCMTTIDENKGYGKGSVVVSYGNKTVNFPIIINDYKISPFDVFISSGRYIPLDVNSLKRHLLNSSLGVVQNLDTGMTSGLKTPGGINPKRSVSMDSTEPYRQQPNIEKLSSLASKNSIEKLAQQLVYEPDLMESFHDHTGDLVTQMIDTVQKDYQQPRLEQKGILDLGQIIDAKDAVAVIDTEMFDVNQLVPIKPPSVCELRLYSYPTIEDFLSSNVEKITASKNGKSISGIVVDVMSDDNYDNEYRAGRDTDKKELKNRRDQVFFSLDGKYMASYDDWEKTGIGFYGIPMNGNMQQAVKMISDHTTNDFVGFKSDNNTRGADAFFNPNPIKSEKTSYGYDTKSLSCGCGYGDLYVIYGNGDSYQATKFDGQFKRVRVDGNYSFVSQDVAIIPSGVVSIQKVSGAQGAYYKMLTGNAKRIFLIPESSVIISTKFITNLSRNDIMVPSKSLQKVYQEAGIENVKVAIDGNGYNITGAAVEQLPSSSGLTTKEAMTVLKLVGVNGEQATEILKTAVNKTVMNQGSTVVYGVRGDYINDKITPALEKQARVKNLMKQYAQSLRVDLVKEASVLTNPEAVDVVLSLNFINEDNLNDYVNNIPQFEGVNCKLAELLVASRMGLTDMDEGAIKKSINGITSVVHGLENLRLSVNR